MQPQDGLEITVFIPAFLIPVIVLLLIGVIGGAGVAVWRYRQRQQRMADRLRAAQAAAELAGGMHGANPTADAYRNFIRDISHEISNPLQSIQTNLDIMALCTPEETGRWRQYHGAVAGEVRRLSALTNQLRLLALLETPNAPQVREPVNMKAVIEDVIMALAEEGEQRQVRLSYVGPERPARVLGNRDQLRQVLLNLADNGIKYSKPGGGAVMFNVQEHGARLRVRVSDDGVGIPPEALEHIGEDVYRVPNPASFQRKGSGLGLAIAKRIVEQHGDRLTIQSQPGEGTTVSFDLSIYHSGKAEP
jgi:signal transduction histidine kinase